MIYSKDQWIQLPTKDLYDSQIMMASINAAKDMYEKGVQEMKDFNKLYGDFTSPIARDVDYWYDNTMKPIRDAVNYMYENGIDPTRSAEGRAFVQRLINQVPVAQLNKIRQSAKVAEEYVKNRGTMQANGLYDPGFEQFALRDQYGRPVDLSNWSTVQDGTWERTAPYKFESLFDYTSPMFKDLKPHELTQQEVESFGMQYDPRYQYQGISKGDLERVTGDRVPGIQNDTLYKYYRELAADKLRKQAIANGQDPTKISETDIDNQFVNDVIQANSAHIMEPTKSADQYALAAQNQAYDMQKLEYQQKHEDDRFNKDLAYKYWQTERSEEGADRRALLQAGYDPSTGKPLAGLESDNVGRGVYDRLLDDVSTNIKQRDDKYLKPFRDKANNTYNAFLRNHKKDIAHDNSGKAWTGQAMVKKYYDIATSKGYTEAEKWLVKNFNKSWRRANKGAFWKSFDAYRAARKNYEMPSGMSSYAYVGYKQGVIGPQSASNNYLDSQVNAAFQTYLISRDATSAALLRSAIPTSEVKDKNNHVVNYRGRVGNNTTLAVVGKNRIVRGTWFKHNTPESKLNRAIKGLVFTVKPGDVNTARYGAGTGLGGHKGMHGFVYHTITFTKEQLKASGFDPDKYKSQWKHLGIAEDASDAKYVTVQVITDISDSQAAINTKGDKEWGGTTYSKSRIARNQAVQEQRNVTRY